MAIDFNKIRGNKKAFMDFTQGLHQCKVISLDSMDEEIKPKDNGESVTISARIIIGLEDSNGNRDKHTFFYKTEPETDENGVAHQTIAAKDWELFCTIIQNLYHQIADDATKLDKLKQYVADEADLADPFVMLQALLDSKVEFDVMVSFVERTNGTGLWKQISYNKDLCAIA